MMRTFTQVANLGLAALLALAAPTVRAQATYPAKPIKVIVSSAAGSAPDSVVRVVTAAMGDELKQAFVVDNRVGANGMIGLDAAARAPADGYNLLVAPLGTVAVNPHLYAK